MTLKLLPGVPGVLVEDLYTADIVPGKNVALIAGFAAEKSAILDSSA